MLQRSLVLLACVLLLPAASRGKSVPAPAPLNTPAATTAFNTEMTHVAIQSAYDRYNNAVTELKTGDAMRFQTDEYTEIGQNGQAKPQSPEQARQSLLTLFHNYVHVYAASRVGVFTLDAAGGAVVLTLDRRTLFSSDGSPGTQSDRRCRDYLVQDGGTWRLARRRVLSETRTAVQAPAQIPPPMTAQEQADPVFGAHAAQPVLRYTFLSYFFGSPVVLQFFNQGRSASRTLPPGRPAADYARACADIFTELGVKSKCEGNRVYLTEAKGDAVSGNSKVDFQLDTLHP